MEEGQDKKVVLEVTEEERKVALEVADADFFRFARAWDLDTEFEEFTPEDKDAFLEQKRKIVRQICGGRAAVNEEGNIVYQLFEPVGTLTDVLIRRPKGMHFVSMDKEKEGRNISKMIQFISASINQLPGIVKKMDGVDVKFLQAVYMLFLGS